MFNWRTHVTKIVFNWRTHLTKSSVYSSLNPGKSIRRYLMFIGLPVLLVLAYNHSLWIIITNGGQYEHFLLLYGNWIEDMCEKTL